MAIFMRVLTILLAVLFLATGGAKLAGVQKLVDSFHHFGYPDWFRYVVGITEVAAAIGLLIPSLSGYAALLLVPIMIGAVASHLKVSEPFVFPLLVLALVVGAAFYQRPTFLRGQESAHSTAALTDEG